MMKYKTTIVFLIVFTLTSKAVDQRLDSIRSDVGKFLVQVEGMDTISVDHITFPCFLIVDLLTGDSIKSGAEGIFRFNFLSDYSNDHILLVGKKGYYIINMYQPIDENGKIFLQYFKDQKYSKEDIIQCLYKIFSIANSDRKFQRKNKN
jgi:hypothetical protein